ncbi:MAG: D-alanine--D-alanine ligase [Planctomycetota bacterium]
MRIALTYDLRSEYLALGWTEEEAAEFDSDSTIVAIEETLSQLGHGVERVGRCQELAKRLVQGDKWDLVFNIAEGARGRSREAQVPALLECFDVPYTFCDPLTAALTLDKALAKRVVRDAGLPTPDFVFVESPEDARRINLPFPLFVKPRAEGTGKGIDAKSVVRDAPALVRACDEMLARFPEGLLVEVFLPGREVTVGVVGTGRHTRALGVMEIVLREDAEREVYSFRNKELCEERVHYRLTENGALWDEAERIALASYRVLGCRDAGRVDLRADADGRLHFLEVNPLAGLHPEHSDLPILNRLVGRTYRALIADIVTSASERVQGNGRGRA